MNKLMSFFLIFLFFSCKNETITLDNEVVEVSRSDNFENSLEDFWLKELVDEERATLTIDPLDKSNKVLKVDLKLDDYVSGGKRSELLFFLKEADGYKSYYTFRFMLPESFFQSDEKKGSFIIHQWHDAPAPGHSWKTYNIKTKPPVHLLVEHTNSSDYYLKFNTGLESGTMKEIKSVTWKEKLVPNKWYTFSCEILWGLYDKEAYCIPKIDNEFFINFETKEEVQKITARNMYNTIPNYFKFGLYRSGIEEFNRTLYFDDFEYGDKQYLYCKPKEN